MLRAGIVHVYASDMQWRCKHTWYSFAKKIHMWHLCKTVIMFTCAQKNTSHQKRPNSTARNSNSYVKIQWAKKPNSGTERGYRKDQRVWRQTGSALQRATGKICNKLQFLTIQKYCNSTPERSRAKSRVLWRSPGQLWGPQELPSLLQPWPQHRELPRHPPGLVDSAWKGFNLYTFLALYMYLIRVN